jgi:hypothetical protein
LLSCKRSDEAYNSIAQRDYIYNASSTSAVVAAVKSSDF